MSQTSENFLPASTGQDIGSPSQRWDVYAQNIDTQSHSVTASGAFTDSATDSYGYVAVGGLTNSEFHTIQTTGYASEGVAGYVAVPNTATKLQTNAVSGAVTNASTTTNAVGGYFTARALANGTHLWGINPLVQIDTYTGVDAQAIEADVNINTTNIAVANGLTCTGNFSAQPTSGANGVVVNKPMGTGIWNYGYVLNDGAAQIGMSIGASATAGSCDSMPILLQGKTAGVAKNVQVLAYQDGSAEFRTNDGNPYFFLNNAAGVQIPGSTSGNTILKSSAVASGTLTLPAATDTLVGKATTDVLTNKTLTAPIIGGVVPTYNSINTVSNGIPAEYAAVDLTAQGAAISPTTLYAVPASGSGMYRISYVATITRAGSVSSTLGGSNGFQVVFTSPTDSVAKTTPAGPNSSANTTATCVSGSIVVYAKASTNIQYQFGYTDGGATTMQYELHVKLEAL